MKHEKLFTVTLNVEPKHISPNIDKYLLERLEENYKGKCFKDSLILDSLRIRDRTPLEMNKSELGGTTHTTISFSAQVFTLSVGEYVVGKVIQKGSGFYLISGDHWVCYHKIGNTKHKIGEKIVLHPLSTYYQMGETKVAVTAKFFMYPEPRVFNCSGVINQTMLAPYIEEISELKKKLPKDWKKIDTLLRSKTKIVPLKGKKHSLLKPKFVGTFTRSNLLDEEVIEGGDVPIVETATRAYQTLLVDYLNYLNLLIHY